MTDALSEIAKNQRETAQLLKDGKIIKCFVCWNSIKNDKEHLKEHLKERHTINEIVNEFTSITIGLWNTEYKESFNKLYKVK